MRRLALALTCALALPAGAAVPTGDAVVDECVRLFGRCRLGGEGVKTEASDKHVTANFAELHLNIGVGSLKQLINKGLTVKHLRFEV